MIFLQRLYSFIGFKRASRSALLPSFFAAKTDLLVRITEQDPLLRSTRRWRPGSCGSIATGRSKGDVPALEARHATVWHISNKRQCTNTVTNADSRETWDLCMAGVEHGTCTSLVFSVTCCITEILRALSRLSLQCLAVLCSGSSGQTQRMLLPTTLPCWDSPSHQSLLPSLLQHSY